MTLADLLKETLDVDCDCVTRFGGAVQPAAPPVATIHGLVDCIAVNVFHKTAKERLVLIANPLGRNQGTHKNAIYYAI